MVTVLNVEVATVLRVLSIELPGLYTETHLILTAPL